MTGNIDIIEAGIRDAEVASSIMCEAALWLKEQGMTLWFPDELGSERLQPFIDAGELYLVMMQGHPVGTVIYQHSDRLFWPDMPEGDAAYIHKITVKRSAAGQGLVPLVIAWARQKAQREGRRYLRLDTEASREKLCALYESAGFSRHSYRQVGRHYVVRYEMEL
jgi:ribosomal protein S18 acetylase RimI-like enzyme